VLRRNSSGRRNPALSGKRARAFVDAALYDIGEDARIPFADRWLPDKFGAFALRRAGLVIKRNDKWQFAGSGTIAYSDD